MNCIFAGKISELHIDKVNVPKTTDFLVECQAELVEARFKINYKFQTNVPFMIFLTNTNIKLKK